MMRPAWEVRTVAVHVSSATLLHVRHVYVCVGEDRDCGMRHETEAAARAHVRLLTGGPGSLPPAGKEAGR